jgi:ABC-type dipeptide/oligopeptide/nickel transport system permease subunit
MGYLADLKTWYRWGHWLDTPQGICVMLSFPVCWLAALISFLWQAETRPLFLSDGPVLFLFTPLLAFLCFVRFGQRAAKQYSSSLLTTVFVLTIIGMPFYAPYFRSHGT